MIDDRYRVFRLGLEMQNYIYKTLVNKLKTLSPDELTAIFKNAISEPPEFFEVFVKMISPEDKLMADDPETRRLDEHIIHDIIHAIFYDKELIKQISDEDLGAAFVESLSSKNNSSISSEFLYILEPSDRARIPIENGFSALRIALETRDPVDLQDNRVLDIYKQVIALYPQNETQALAKVFFDDVIKTGDIELVYQILEASPERLESFFKNNPGALLLKESLLSYIRKYYLHHSYGAVIVDYFNKINEVNKNDYDFVSDENNFSSFVSQSDFVKLFRNETNKKIAYENLVNHDNFLDIIKTEQGLSLLNQLSREYKESKGTGYKQGLLIEKIKTYIEKSPDTEQDLKALVENLGHEGLCGGLSYLYSVYKTLGKEEIFFKKLKTILQWDGIRSLDQEERDVYEEIVGQVIVAQDTGVREIIGPPEKPTEQSEPTRISRFLSPNIMLREESRIYKNSETKINSYLRSAPEDQAINIAGIYAGAGHAMVIFKKDGKYCFYDPNDYSGEVIFDSPEKLTSYMYEAILMLGTMKRESIGFVLRIYTTDKELLKKAEQDPMNSGIRKEIWDRIFHLVGDGEISACESLISQLIASKNLDVDFKQKTLESYANFLIAYGKNKPSNPEFNNALIWLAELPTSAPSIKSTPPDATEQKKHKK